MKALFTHVAVEPDKSLRYYERLGFTINSLDNAQHLISAAGISFLLDERPFIRPGWVFYGKETAELQAKLKQHSQLIPFEEGWLSLTTCGAWLRLVESLPPVISTHDALQDSALGSFAGWSMETLDLRKSQDFWNSLGFDLVAGDSNSSWITMRNGNTQQISFMKYGSCPHLFLGASLTFFNGKDNVEVIQGLKALGIPILQDVRVFSQGNKTENVVLQDPSGLGIFVFNDE